MFTHGSLLISGGTGTFGNATLARFRNTDIREIRIFSRDEKKQEDMRLATRDARLQFYIGDVRSYESVCAAMRGVDFVFHAAALKQVPSCEFHPLEAIKTNALGAENVMNAAVASGVKRLVVLSTDKAVYPINAMGLSKALMEKLMVAKARLLQNGPTVLCGTRYGNVMCSRGSVIPLFIQQIKAGQPLTVTDPNMTRFMMSIEGAVDLVLFAFEHGRPGDIFVQKAPAATIETLARALLRVFDAKSPLRIIGTRHGEKLYETLLTREELSRAEDMGHYYRIPADTRDLNYNLYFSEGEERVSHQEDYNSHNTRRLEVDQMAEMLLTLDFVQQELAGGAPVIQVLVTGGEGFVGRNLRLALGRTRETVVTSVDLGSPPEVLRSALASCNVVFHLAGVNRPQREEEFEEGNVGVLRELLDGLVAAGRRPLIVLSSSIQAEFDNPYGRSKRHAEEALLEHARSTNTPVRVFRLPNVFGKWCRPNYNSAVATFCYSIARGLPITVSDASRGVELVHIDDVVARLLELAQQPTALSGSGFESVTPTFKATLGRIVELLRSFQTSRETLLVPDLADPFVRRLHATYLSYLPSDGFAYDLQQRTDARGVLAELLKGPSFGQIFVSRTRPGITRGNHYHDSKVEKFAVLEGEAVIRFRSMTTGEVVSYPVQGRELKVVDIPPGWTHSIENVGSGEMIVLFWASEIFDPTRPDTDAAEVGRG